MFECNECKNWYNEELLFIHIAHTEIDYCESCWNNDQPERLNPEDQFVEVNKLVFDSPNHENK